jgi:hypothetical protein
MTPARRRLWPIAIVLAVVGLYRFSLVGRGVMSIPDEQMYFKAGLALSELRARHLGPAVAHLASNFARPGSAIIQLVPAALQAIPFAYGVPTSNPRSLMIPVAMNVTVTLVTLWVFWRVSLILFGGGDGPAAIAAAIYGLLLNSNVYVRHVLAYEPAMCLGMIAVWMAVSQPGSGRLALAIGVVSGLAMTVYPGYYGFALVPGAVLMTARDAERSRLSRGVMFVTGAALVMASMAVFCWIGSVNYLAEARRTSRLIVQGSFAEGFSFVPRYLVEVERLSGVLLLVGFAAWLCRLAVERARGERVRPVQWLVLAACGGWLWQASGAYFAHAMVLNGRLTHPWMAFLVWATIDAIGWAPRGLVSRSLSTVAVGVALYSWIGYVPEYAHLAYPGDVLYERRINTAWLPAADRTCAMQPLYPYDSPAPVSRVTNEPYVRQPVSIENFCIGVPPVGSAGASSHAPAGKTVIFEAPHFMAFRAYRFEGLTPEERDAIQRREFWLRVYE